MRNYGNFRSDDGYKLHDMGVDIQKQLELERVRSEKQEGETPEEPEGERLTPITIAKIRRAYRSGVEALISELALEFDLSAREIERIVA